MKVLWALVTLISVLKATESVESISNGENVFSAEAWEDEEIIYSHLELGASLEPHSDVQHPTVGIDRLCSSKNTNVDTCTIENKSLRFTSDIYYETSLSLHFKASKIKCLTVNYQPCTLHFRVNGKDSNFVLKEGSTLVGKQVIIEVPEAQVEVLEDSTVWASGQSLMTLGTKFRDNRGASFIGEGGACDQSYRKVDSKNYGTFDMIPTYHSDGALDDHYDHMIGSIGKEDDVETAGGGRIAIVADSVVLRGPGEKIQANARPYMNHTARSYDLTGGSGGYIYVKTTNQVNQNLIDDAAEITARGGFAQGDHGAGSGGVIVFDDEFHISHKQVHANGGKASDESETSGCLNGAAGTVFMVKNNTLVVDNEGSLSTKTTTIKMPQAQSDEDVPFLCDKLYVQNKARLLLEGEHRNLGFHELTVHDESWLKLGESSDKIHLHLKNNTHLSSTSTLDFSSTQWVGIFNEFEYGEKTVTVGNVNYQSFFGIKAAVINIGGTVKVDDKYGDPYKKVSKILFEGDRINFFNDANVQAAYSLIQADSNIMMEEDAKVTSYIEHTCNTNKASDELFQCIKKFSLNDQFGLDEYMGVFHEQFPGLNVQGNFVRFNDTLPYIMKNYTIFIISFGNIRMHRSQIEGPRVAICSQNLYMDNAVISASKRGCESDDGFGKGVQNEFCAGQGASHGGSGGYGGVESSDKNDHHACKTGNSGAYYFGDTIKYEGSGGASGSRGARMGGSGGGIIMINTLGTTEVKNGLLEANGGEGTKISGSQGSGGGAGGAVQVVTTNLKGNGHIEAMGGDGSVGAGGGGAGGRFVVNFLKGHVASAQPAQSHYWSGSYSLAGGISGHMNVVNDDYLQGKDGQRGIIESSKCFGGYSGPFCEPCPEGTFKYDYSYAVCKPCENKPQNAFYTQLGSSSSNCGYQCSSGLDTVDINPYCHSALQLQVERLGGVQSSLIVFGSFLALVLVLWIALIIHSKSKASYLNKFNKNVYDGVLFTDSETIDASEDLPDNNNLGMKDTDIWSHTARMYLIGENSISFPWYIPRDFPARALDVQNKDKFLRFIKSNQNCLDWTALQKDTYVVSRLFFPPLANIFHRCFRKRHFNALKENIYNNFDRSFWDERGQKTIRVSTSTTDNQLAYIDFLNYERSKSDYIGPQIPLTLLLAGSGTFNSPYYLNFEDDALAKSVVYFHQQTLKNKLPLFFENLNTLLSKLSFYKFTRATMRDLSEVIEWVEMGNKTLFNPLDIKATLYLFENSYCEVEGSAFRQRRRNFPLESLVFESFPDLFKNMIKFVQTKLLGKKSEIRLGLVFKPFSLEKKRRLIDRIRKINQQENSEEIQFDQSSTTLIYGSDEDDDQEPSYPHRKLHATSGKSASLGNIRRADKMQESATGLLEESKMLESTVNIYGSDEDSIQVKILDKSKRAFDISTDSTKALEISLQKPRNACKYKCKRINAWFYALFTLAFKYHGKPPSRSSATFHLLLFSFLLTVDIMLTVNFGFHLYKPDENMIIYGVPFLLLYPFVTVIGPILGMVGSIFGSPTLLKGMSSVNATSAMINYPLTVASMVYHGDEPFYIATIAVLWFNKILLSFAAAKVRQHLLNPTFTRNSERIEERFQALVHAKADLMEGIHPSLVPKSAKAKVSQGPSEDKHQSEAPGANTEEPLDESDGEEQSFEPFQ